MKRTLCIAGLATAITCFSRPVQAGKLRTLWEVDLGRLANASGGLPEFPVYAIVRFRQACMTPPARNW
jgi:hypothetical protein